MARHLEATSEVGERFLKTNKCERKNNERRMGLSGREINIRLLPSIFYLLMMIMHYSCIQRISEPGNDIIQIIGTSVELDRFEN